MRCIFCLQERPESLEHVFPYAIGGSLTTKRVCSQCNSDLGSRVDSALTDNFLVRNRRAHFGIKGNSGEAPSLFEILEGTAKLADGSGTVQATFNKGTGKLDLKLHTRIERVAATTDTVTYQYKMDPTEIGRLPKLLQRKQRQHGKRPLTDEEIANFVEEAHRAAITVQNPEVRKTLSVDFSYVRHALFKIAYELAFLWLGDDYLDDEHANHLRAGIVSDKRDSLDDVPGHVEAAADDDFFKIFNLEPHEHVAFSQLAGDVLVIVIRIFDVYVAVIPVTMHVSRYLKATPKVADFKFVSLNSLQRSVTDTTLEDKIMSMVHARRAAFESQESLSVVADIVRTPS